MRNRPSEALGTPSGLDVAATSAADRRPVDQRPRVALMGSVNSSLETLEQLIKHQCNVVMVLGLPPEKASRVSGYQDIVARARAAGIPAMYFHKASDPAVYEALSPLGIDYLFVVGLSQLIRPPLLDLARRANVGFHPTRLPEGRGRGAIAWLVLGRAAGAATFFELGEGMDDGPILAQVPFTVAPTDYASDVIETVRRAARVALDDLLPALNAGTLVGTPQVEANATYLGQRRPHDGIIDWDRAAVDVHRLIRATSSPLPGARSYCARSADAPLQITIWRAEVLMAYAGVPGRIIAFRDELPVVACAEGALHITQYTADEPPTWRIGTDLITPK